MMAEKFSIAGGEIPAAGRDRQDVAHADGSGAGVCPEDRDRVALYGLLASGLQGPVGQDWLDVVSGLSGGGGDLAEAISGLAVAAAQAEPEPLARDYHDLFIGVGRGELVPYGSYYLTGFLNEKPLALLRQDMRRLGIERDPGVKEPEDHIAALCQMMAGLIEGDFGDGSPAASSRFFRAHPASWTPYFFKDLEATDRGAVYPALGRLGRVFIELEEHADALFEEQRGAG
ncbi:molecular chaperone [Stappia sp. ES.058]|uniref:TorD/DmsD family molecular chaperone n=1 Tax=Stappia sp. ES.058 TaxID=1881061 RepID=UPI00087D749E|nr:molecular chaperone TorD family protein [Stappia sp. ES.058]SDU05010.1 chaperone TorD involved in molybdoenzyme TorA maturation [Stappia sp. ES.058]